MFGSSPAPGERSGIRNRSISATTSCKGIAGTYCLFLFTNAFH